MHRVKQLGQSLMARDFDRQVADVQLRIAVLNGYTSLGIPSTKTMRKSVWEKGNHGHQPICATESLLSTQQFLSIMVWASTSWRPFRSPICAA